MALAAQTIRRRKLIEPCLEPYRHRGISGGLDGAGYSVRVAQTFWMWPFRFVLASTIEKFNMPLDLGARVHDKSTWVRLGVTAQNTWIDPGWTGYLTVELRSNSWWRIFKIHAGTPIVQIVFDPLDEPTQIPYRGKYQDQPEGPQKSLK